MALAATFAGMGFGNAGVHIPHANAYPIAGQVRDFRPEGYPDDEAMVPHGMAVSLTAPEAFRFTFEAVAGAAPARGRAARARAPTGPPTCGPSCPHVLAELMRDIGIPDGIGAVGYGEGDVDDLVEGALKQQRLLATAPREVTEDDLAGILAPVARAVVTASLSADLVAALRRAGVADVDDSTLARALYATDASLYRVVPQVVVRPRARRRGAATVARRPRDRRRR